MCQLDLVGSPHIPQRHLHLAMKTVYIRSRSVGRRLPAKSSPAWSPGKGPSLAVLAFYGEKEHVGLAVKEPQAAPPGPGPPDPGSASLSPSLDLSESSLSPNLG